MSYDVYLTGEGTHYHDGYAWNYTWNMAYAIRHGGIEIYRRGGWLYDQVTGVTTSESGLFVLEGSRASAAAVALANCITTIERDAEMLRAQEPEDGWGSVDRVVEVFLRPILDACSACPNAVVQAS